jgi:UDP-N-acetyl-D-mannosaminuronate dehydrogenase
VARFVHVVITVPTPLRDRSPDLSFVMDAARELSRFVTPGSLVVLESTTYPGTTDDLLRPILEQGSSLLAGADFALAYCPHELGVDAWEVRATCAKPFGFLPFTPGPGVGGHCLPIDPTYLSWHVEQATGRGFASPTTSTSTCPTTLSSESRRASLRQHG